MTQIDCQEYRFTQNHIFGIQNCSICHKDTLQISLNDTQKQTKKKTMKFFAEDFSVSNQQVHKDLQQPVQQIQDFNPAPLIQPQQETVIEFQQCQQPEDTSQGFNHKLNEFQQLSQGDQGFNPFQNEFPFSTQQIQQQYYTEEYSKQFIDNYTYYYNQMQLQQQMHQPQQMYQQPGHHQQNFDQQNFQQLYDLQNDDDESMDEDIINQCINCQCCKGDVYGCKGETCIMLGSCYCLMKLEMEKNAEEEEINKFFVEEMQKKNNEEQNYQ